MARMDRCRGNCRVTDDELKVSDETRADTCTARPWPPRFWPLLALLAILRLAVALPLRWQLFLGRGLGRVLERLATMRRGVVASNLELCFPHDTPSQRARLQHKHFESLGMMVFEMGLAWWASDKRLARLTQVEGLENLLAPLREGQGVVVLSGHFSGQELTGRVVAKNVERSAAVYRRSRYPFFEWWLRRSRLQAVDRLIEKEDVRQMLRLLRKGWPVWYAPDQSYRRKHSALVPFFGEPAMTSTALSEIVRLGRAKVVPYLPRRLDDGSGYRVQFLPALENFPSGDGIADAERVNNILEAHIRGAPEQYYWVHRRFKSRPGLADPYRERKSG